MATLNLLPWREQLREERKQEFLIGLGVMVGFAFFLLLLIHWVMVARVDHQIYRNQYLQDQITQLDKQIQEIDSYRSEKNEILLRTRIIWDLQANRPFIVHLLTDFVKAVPPGLFLTQLQRKDNMLTIGGRAEGNAIISQFMRNLDASLWLQTAVLNQIQNDQTTGLRRSDFEVSVQQVGRLSQNKNLSDLSKQSEVTAV